MKGIRNILVAGCSLFLLCQCATQDDLRKLNYQVRAVNQKVDDVKNSTVDKLQKRQASSVSKIDRVDEELVQLKARLEENAHQASLYHEQNRESLAALQAALEERIAANEQKTAALQRQIQQLTSGIDSMQQARIREAERRAREAARKAELAKQRTVMAAASSPSFVKVTPAGRKVRVGSGQAVSMKTNSSSVRIAEPETVSAPSGKEKNGSSVQTVVVPDNASAPFDQAMAKFKAKQYKDAYAGFEQVLVNNPRGEQAAQTLFYMGESLYNQGEYDLAILDYQKVISNHAKDPHTPAALLKQGMSFEKLTDNETAKIIYKKLINEYAGSPEAGKAKKRLENL
jgi:tol-pal system protein YbgF